MSNLKNKLARHQSIRRHEITCPVSGQKLMVSPLTLGDDTDLRTMITNIDMYENILIEVIYKHVTFMDVIDEENPNSISNITDFKKNISNYDKKMLLYGIHLVTYGNMGKEEITCSKCDHKYSNTIYTKDLEVTVDSWDKDVHFSEFKGMYKLNIDDGIIKSFNFTYGLPSIHDNLKLLSILDINKIKVNIDKLGSVLDQPEELALVTSQIEVISFDDANAADSDIIPVDSKGVKTPVVEEKEKLVSDIIDNYGDIHTFISNYLELDLKQPLIDAYFDEFKKYEPKFKAVINCPSCGKKTDINVDIESALIRSFLRRNNK